MKTANQFTAIRARASNRPDLAVAAPVSAVSAVIDRRYNLKFEISHYP
jgi:hypothetical protein